MNDLMGSRVSIRKGRKSSMIHRQTNNCNFPNSSAVVTPSCRQFRSLYSKPIASNQSASVYPHKSSSTIPSTNNIQPPKARGAMAARARRLNFGMSGNDHRKYTPDLSQGGGRAATATTGSFSSRSALRRRSSALGTVSMPVGTAEKPLLPAATYDQGGDKPSKMRKSPPPPAGGTWRRHNSFSTCQKLSCEYPYSFNIFLPGDMKRVMEFIESRKRLMISGLKCRIRLGLNDIVEPESDDRRRLIRVEGKTRDDLVKCIDLFNEIFPHWRVWENGELDKHMLL